MTSSTSSQPMTIAEEIKQHLSDATPQQVKDFATQVQRLRQVKEYLESHPDDREFAQEQLELAQNALNYTQPYCIAVIGKTGAGKSTTINALLGRPLVLARQGPAATGIALRIFLDVVEGGQEVALVKYRNEANIRQLVQHFITSYKIDSTPLPQSLNPDYAKVLINLQPKVQLQERALKDFEDLRRDLHSIVMQYSHNPIQSLRKKYQLAVESDREELLQLTDENSEVNQSPQRRIGLVESLTYHIKPTATQGVPALRLPSNVCLVDLPGLDGSPLHNIIISEGIRETHAVVFVTHPTTLRETGDEYLLDRVRRHIGQGGNPQSGEKIFLALNAHDHISKDSEQSPEKIYKRMQEITEYTIPGYTQYPELARRGGKYPFFLTSSRAAYLAQKSLQSEVLENPEEYESIKLILGLQGQDDREVLEASQIPKLATALTTFARDNRISGQIRDGQLALDNLIGGLYNKYLTEKNQYDEQHGSFSAEREFSKSLRRREEDLERLIYLFHKRVANSFDQWKEQCQPTIKTLCDETDRYLLEKLPQMWQDASYLAINPIDRELADNTSYSQVMGSAEAILWRQLTVRVPRLSDRFVEFYRQAILTDQLLQQVVERCYGYAIANELKAHLNDWTQQMHRKLSGVAERIALTMMTDPGRCFSTGAAHTKNPALRQSLEQISAQHKPDKQAFVPFMTAVRKHYQPSVEGSLFALLNLFRYEMLVVEAHLLDHVRDIFNRLALTKDTAVMQMVLNNSTNAELERLKQVEQKLVLLSKLLKPLDYPFDAAE